MKCPVCRLSLSVTFCQSIKSADEKLRSIGKAQQPATSVQTQNFTFVRHNSQSKQHHLQVQQHKQQQQKKDDIQLESLQQQTNEQQQSIEKQQTGSLSFHDNTGQSTKHPGRRLSEQEIIQHQIEQELKRNTWKEERPQQIQQNWQVQELQKQLQLQQVLELQHQHRQVQELQDQLQKQLQQQQQVKVLQHQPIYDNLPRLLNDHRRASLPAGETGGEEVERGEGQSEVSLMAERAIASRLGRRDRNALDSAETSEVKRRSRSEGPVKGRVRHSMDERGGRAGKKQTFDGARVRGFCMDDGDSESSGDVSDPGRGSYQNGGRGGAPRADSDSDSDRAHRAKNLLVLRRFKKSDKHARNRLSAGSSLVSSGGAADSGSGPGGFYGNEDAAASSGGGGGGGSGSGGRSKYQRLEEMRKKRINMAATSDEEGAATPAVRISRLRQRALQSGLGGSGTGPPARPVSSFVPSSRNFGNVGSGSGSADKTSTPMANFVPYHREISNTSTSSSSQQPQSWSNVQPLRQFPTNLQVQNRGPSSFGPVNPDNSTINASQRPQYGVRTPPARPPPPNIQIGGTPKVGKSTFFTIPDASNPQHTSRALYLSSPDTASQRYNNQSRVPSADFILNPPSQQGNRVKNITSINLPGKPFGAGVGIQSGSSQATASRIPTQFTEVVEPRLTANFKSNNQETPKVQTKIPKKGIIQKLGLTEDYEDSLDELIESNIQYLDKEINKISKIKRGGEIGISKGNKVPLVSDSRRVPVDSPLASTSRKQFQEFPHNKQEQQQQQQLHKSYGFQSKSNQPAINVQSNTSIQLHVSLPTNLKDSEPPRIQIAPPNDFFLKPYPLHADAMSSSMTTKLDHMQPDVVPRKYSYDSSGLRLQRPNSGYQYFGDQDDLSKSDSQLNTNILPRQMGYNVEDRPGMSMGGGSLNTHRVPQLVTTAPYQTRGCVSEINLSSEPTQVTDRAVASSSNGDLLQVLQVDKGMFSDMEYDIEVSERVKKWETFMKDRDSTAEKKSGVGSLNLAPIQENTEASSEPLMVPSAVRRSVLMGKASSTQLPASSNSISAYSSSLEPTPPISAFSYSTTEGATYTPPPRHRPFSSDTSINRIGDKMLSVDPSSTQRFFNPVPDPLGSGSRLGPLGAQNSGLCGAQSTSSLFQQPGPIKIKTSYAGNYERSVPSAFEIKNQMLSNRQPLLPLMSGSPVQAVHQAPQSTPLQITSISSASTPPPGSSNNTPIVVRRRKPSRENAVDPRDPNKRGSKYQEEIDEINNVRTDSVVNLRKRFDADTATMTSEDDQKSVVSTASAKLSRRGRMSGATSGRVSGHRSGAESSSNDLNLMIPGYEKKIRDSDVWSPNLESTQGVPVSIERVTARTLQTIPFSEDPFWKELEEMTSFDPNSMAGHLSLGASQDGGPTPTEPFMHVKPHQHLEALSGPSSHSSTLPAATSLTHSRNSELSAKERMQRSKSLYTPNITPLSIEVDRTNSAVSALDEVLDDINRSSMERKQLSPKKSPTKSSAFLGAGYLKPKQDVPQSTFKFEDGQFKFMKTPLVEEQGRRFDTGSLAQMRAEQVALPQKQPLQFYQLQRQQQDQPFKLQAPSQDNKANRQSQTYSNVNSYQLDPNLLKEKLLNTGLVVETDTEESAPASAHITNQAPLVFTQMPFTLSNPPLSQANQSTFKSLNSSARPGSMFAGGISNTPSGQRRFSGDASNTSNPFQSFKVGTSALDEIQRALAPFSNTSSSYTPGPESLYGTARLESFMDDSGLNTTSGPNTQPTSWTYQPSKREAFLSSSGGVPGGHSEDAASSSSRLQQVNASMDDLKDLAQNVERRINVIRTRLQSADEGSLDTILSSLKNLQPDTEVRRGGDAAAAAAGDPDSASTFEDFYTSKKTKLSKALTELDRIYKSLDLNSDDMTGLPEKPHSQHNLKLYRPTKSSNFILAPQPKSIHLRPMQTRISSVYIPGLEKQKADSQAQSALDKETESEFDVISKSFQAIVDEVNQTTNLLSTSKDDALKPSPLELKEPVSSNAVFQVELKPEIQGVSNSKPSGNLTTEVGYSDVQTKIEAPKTAPKPQDLGSTRGKDITTVFKPQVSTYDNVTKEEFLLKAESKTSNPESQISQAKAVDTKLSHLQSTTQPQAFDNVKSIPSLVNSPQAPRQRVRPVKDNRIVQDDKKASAERRESGGSADKILGMPPSPGPSPKISRKIVYNNASELESKIIKPPEMFQDDPTQPKAQNVSKTTNESKPATVKNTLNKSEEENSKSKAETSKPSVQAVAMKKPGGPNKISQFEMKQTAPSSASPSSVRRIPALMASRQNQKIPENGVSSPKAITKNQHMPASTGSASAQQKQLGGSSMAEIKRETPRTQSGTGNTGSRSASNSSAGGKGSTTSTTSINLAKPSTSSSGTNKSSTVTKTNEGSSVTNAIKRLNLTNVKTQSEKVAGKSAAPENVDEGDDDVFVDASSESDTKHWRTNKSDQSSTCSVGSKETKDKVSTAIPKTKLKVPLKSPITTKEKAPGSSESSPRVISSATKSPLQLRRMGPKTTELKKLPASPDVLKKATVTLEKKSGLIDDTKSGVAESNTQGSLGSPTSPGNKPPLHPWKRTPSDSEKPPGVDSTSANSAAPSASGIPVPQSPAASPKPSSKIPRPRGGDSQPVQQLQTNKSGSGGNKKPGELTSPPPLTSTASTMDAVVRRTRPLDRKLQTDTSTSTEGRPHSFHELELTRSHGTTSRSDRDRKCLSSADDGVGTGISSVNNAPVFRSEPSLSGSVVVSHLTFSHEGGVNQMGSDS